MGLNLSQIVNKQVPVQEQSSYDFAFIPPKVNVNVEINSFSINHYANLMDGFKQAYSSTQGATLRFKFSGRRIGILFSRNSANAGTQFGVVSLDVDGTDYGTFDTNQNSFYQTLYNVPYIVATDLPSGEHVLTITKLDANSVSIQGFLVDSASVSQTFMRVGMNYNEMLETGAPSWPIAVGTTDTTIRSGDTWLLNVTLTNTTASPINVTLKSSSGNVIGPFPVPANDIRQIQGPIFFASNLKAVASATGITLVLGGQ